MSQDTPPSSRFSFMGQSPALVSPSAAMAAGRTVHVFDKGWRFKQTDTDEWLPVARVPTNVHLDLLDNKRIEDPFIDFNELKCEWVADKSWTYKAELPEVSAAQKGQKHVLAFDGLDTYVNVKLDGQTVLTSDNMWQIHRVDVTELVGPGKTHELVIDFASALLESQKVKDAYPDHKWVGFNGDMSRLAARKAQYHWGWDWGPVLMTCGPWRQVRLETYYARVADIRVDYKVDSSLQAVSGTITAYIEGDDGKHVEVSVTPAGGSEAVFKQRAKVGSDGTAKIDLLLQEIQLWWPHGYGRQPLYDIRVAVSADEVELDSASRRTAFRKAELVQETDKIGKSFYFRINDVDIFCGGSDWIPADSFTPRVTEDKYRKWLQMMVDGYQVMIRNWGGGNWEEDAFYDICDELGVLVWQDFMFGCGNYPAFPAMRKSIERECTDQLKRLRHHPSIVIYAGNNEDYQVRETYHLTYDYEDKDPENWLKTDFPARYIYEKLLPDLVAAHSPHVAYHPGSPWGDGKMSSDPTVGDMHQWNVWHGTQEKYQIFDTLGGRFNSEFGMEAFPHVETIKHYVTDASQLFPQSAVMDFHNKADGHERRIATYLVENLRTSTELARFVHLTQLSQAEALTFGYRGWRRQWGRGRHCGGALVWQLNDCWPVTSWSIVDHLQRKKPAYYAMRRALAPVAAAVKRDHHDWSVVHARPAKRVGWECWVASSERAAVAATVEVRFISVATGREIKDRLVAEDVEIAANGTTDVFAGTIDNEAEEAHVLAARVFVGGRVVARDVDWPQPLKYLEFEDRGVCVEQAGHDRIVLRAERPTKGVVLEERAGVLVDDSAMDLVPGDEQVVTVKGLREGDEPLGWLYYGQ